MAVARALRIFFQAFWGLLALSSAFFSLVITWQPLKNLWSGHLPIDAHSPLPFFSGICVMLAGILFCGAIARVGYSAVFRLSPDIVGATVTLGTTWLQLFVLYWIYSAGTKNHFLADGLKVTSHSITLTLVIIFLYIAPLYFIFFGGSRFRVRVTQAITNLLFYQRP
jgi:hypothetical protein